MGGDIWDKHVPLPAGEYRPFKLVEANTDAKFGSSNGQRYRWRSIHGGFTVLFWDFIVFFPEGAIKNLSEDVPGSDLFFRKITLGIAWKEHWTKTRPVGRPRMEGETARKVGRETLKSKAKVEFPRRVSRHGRWHSKQTKHIHEFGVRWFSFLIHISTTKTRNASEEAFVFEFVSIKQQ